MKKIKTFLSFIGNNDVGMLANKPDGPILTGLLSDFLIKLFCYIMTGIMNL